MYMYSARVGPSCDCYDAEIVKNGRWSPFMEVKLSCALRLTAGRGNTSATNADRGTSWHVNACAIPSRSSDDNTTLSL